ncbi:MAG: hypothetical protein K5866_04895 [Treponema sp.]|nr:hypothetical protein [Treponema sp.]
MSKSNQKKASKIKIVFGIIFFLLGIFPLFLLGRSTYINLNYENEFSKPLPLPFLQKSLGNLVKDNRYDNEIKLMEVLAQIDRGQINLDALATFVKESSAEQEIKDYITTFVDYILLSNPEKHEVAQSLFYNSTLIKDYLNKIPLYPVGTSTEVAAIKYAEIIPFYCFKMDEAYESKRKDYTIKLCDLYFSRLCPPGRLSQKGSVVACIKIRAMLDKSHNPNYISLVENTIDSLFSTYKTDLSLTGSYPQAANYLYLMKDYCKVLKDPGFYGKVSGIIKGFTIPKTIPGLEE